jgi:WD40 repeat protein
MAVAGLEEGGIELWDFVTGKKVSRLPNWEGRSAQVNVSHDGHLLAFAATPRNFGIFDLQKNELIFLSPDLSNSVWQMRWSDDGAYFGIAEGNGQARVLKMNAIRGQLAELGLDWSG